jgi:NTP pyrophosphatase (non-canonical NTP hydrolase)
MTLDEYQKEAARTAAGISVHVATLGLAGESGEVCELVKKYLGHGAGIDPQRVCEELGDVLWYVAALASLFGFTLDDVAAGNIEKLRQRYPNGFPKNGPE